MKKLFSFFVLVFVLAGCSQKPVLPNPTETDIQAQQGLPIFTLDDPTWGEKNAPLQMVVFSDFQCPYCHQFFQSLDTFQSDWIDSGRLVVQFRDFPLAKHVNSLSAHMAAHAANEQGQYLEMHRLLYQQQEEWAASSQPEELFLQYAQELGLDEEQFQQDYNSQEYLAEIKQDRDQGRELGVSGTPAFILNEELYQGAMSQARMEAVLQSTFESL